MNQKPKEKIIYFIRPLWKNISSKRKREVIISLQLIILNGILDLISITSILPLLYLLSAEKQSIMDKFFVKIIINIFNISNYDQILIFSAISFGFVAIFSGLIRLYSLYFNTKLSGKIASELSTNAFSKVINQSYSYHVNLNSSEIITSITTYVNVLNSGLISLMQFITGLVLSSFIVIGTLFINWKLSLYGLIIYSSLYVLIAIYGKDRLNKNSKIVANSNIRVVKGIQESLGSIRDIILDDLHDYYISSHRKIEFFSRKLIAQNHFITFFPRYALETITLVLISLIILFRSAIFGESEAIVPTLGALGIGMQKLLPSFQSLYTSWASLNSQKSSIFKFIKFLELQNKKQSFQNNQIIKIKDNRNISDFEYLKLSNVSFKYENQEDYIFKSLNLEIKKGERIGIIGKTGDGKSTLLDILMGLIEPNSGKFIVNGRDLNRENRYLNLWRKQISHVPQNIYLLDKTIIENIVLRDEQENINFERVSNAVKLAQIDDFIFNSPFKYETLVGERGLKISGGQKQRIGIARALYNIPNILILDEATSALDEETEKLIMESITEINKKMTIIIVAHRLKTMKYCDRVIKLRKGKIVFDGKPSEII